MATAAEEYGYHMGLAFQIVDDILDIVGAADVSGRASVADVICPCFMYPTLRDHVESPSKRCQYLCQDSPSNRDRDMIAVACRNDRLGRDVDFEPRLSKMSHAHKTYRGRECVPCDGSIKYGVNCLRKNHVWTSGFASSCVTLS